MYIHLQSIILTLDRGGIKQKICVDSVFLDTCVSHLNGATRFLFLKSFGDTTYFCFIFKGKNNKKEKNPKCDS